MLRAVSFSHQLIRERLKPGDLAVDATAGNGHDTVFLASLTGPEGIVIAFDVQAEAITATRTALERSGAPAHSWQLIHAGHETMAGAVPEAWQGKAGAVLFNLGYLPGSDKSVTTSTATTLTALAAALRLLRPGGVTVAVLYTGHPGGQEEADAVVNFAASLSSRDYHAVTYRTVNARQSPPFVLAIEKTAAA